MASETDSNVMPRQDKGPAQASQEGPARDAAPPVGTADPNAPEASGKTDQQIPVIVPERNPGDSTVSVTSLRYGLRLAQDIYDESGLFLLAAGTRITPRFLYLLSKRNIRRVKLRSVEVRKPQPTDPQAATTVESAGARKLDEILSQTLNKDVPLRSLRASDRPRLALSNLREEVDRGLEAHVDASATVADVSGRLLGNGYASGEEFTDVVQGFVNMVALDFDLLPMIVGMHEASSDYLFEHCVNVSMVAIGIAAQLGMTREQIAEVGLGALLQDIGMLKVPAAIRLAPRPLNPDERLEVQRHPIYTLDCLEALPGVPLRAGFVGYQVHERLDGSGYPRQRSGTFTHQYAKIAAVADTYAAMTRPRPHRAAILPYRAARMMLIDASNNKLDRTVVRAFLDTMSLFPIGSAVRLSDGRVAKVIRAIPGQHTRPVIEVLDPDHHPTGEVISLADGTSLKVVEALPFPHAQPDLNTP